MTATRDCSRSNQHYNYDRDGNRTKDEKGTYRFNARSQMTSWTRSARYKHPGSHVTYTLAGNGATEKKTDTAGPGSTTTRFKYNGPRLDHVTTDGVRADYDYDSFGNVSKITSQGQSIRYSYDAFERLSKSNSPGKGDDATYTYDPLDRKATRKEDGQTRYLSYVAKSEKLASEAPKQIKKLKAKTTFFDYAAGLDRYGIETVTAKKIAKKKKCGGKKKAKGKKSGKSK